jgi:hypothetical protein
MSEPRVLRFANTLPAPRDAPGGVELVDTLRFQARPARALTRWFVTRLFAHCPAVLRRAFAQG